jgi:hypothetical protein
MQRRVFVKLSTFTAAILTLPLVPGCISGQLDAESQPIFFSHLVDAKIITAVGEAYLATHPEEKNVGKLKAILLPKNGQPGDVNSIGRSLVVKIAADFDSGNTITVSGWVLAITEARQCALFYLQQT